MERDVACELWRKAPQSGVKFSIYVGDDDSTTLADIKNKVPYGVEKWSDVGHAKKSLNTRLYNLKRLLQRIELLNSQFKGYKLHHWVLQFLCQPNVGDPESLKQGLKNIIPHAFGEHTCCNVSWCGFKQNPVAYKHTDLPNGKDLFGDSLKVTFWMNILLTLWPRVGPPSWIRRIPLPNFWGLANATKCAYQISTSLFASHIHELKLTGS